MVFHPTTTWQKTYSWQMHRGYVFSPRRKSDWFHLSWCQFWANQKSWHIHNCKGGIIWAFVWELERYTDLHLSPHCIPAKSTFYSIPQYLHPLKSSPHLPLGHHHFFFNQSNRNCGCIASTWNIIYKDPCLRCSLEYGIQIKPWGIFFYDTEYDVELL